MNLNITKILKLQIKVIFVNFEAYRFEIVSNWNEMILQRYKFIYRLVSQIYLR